MNKEEEKFQIEGLTNAEILELEAAGEIDRVPLAKSGTPGAHHDVGAVPIIIAAASPILTLLGIIIARKGKSSRKRVKIIRITKDEKTLVQIDEQDSAHEAPKAEVVKAVASALKVDPAKIAEALGGK